jgi:hypothetical protein
VIGRTMRQLAQGIARLAGDRQFCICDRVSDGACDMPRGRAPRSARQTRVGCRA